MANEIITPAKYQAYKDHLNIITNGLIEMAKAAGRKEFTANQLLKECYNLIGCELRTEEEWRAQGAYIRRGEYAYLFWQHNIRGGEIDFLFTDEQIKYHAQQLTLF